MNNLLVAVGWLMLTLLGASAAEAPRQPPISPVKDLRTQVRDKFEAEMHRLDAAFDGAMGAQFVDLTDGQVISLHADATFPTASTIKVAILTELFRQSELKPGLLQQTRPFVPTEHTAGTGLARLIGPDSQLALIDIATVMINLSENTATNIIIDEVGMENVNRLTAAMGLSSMRLQRKMLESEAQTANRENITTPADAARLMTAIARCELPVSKPSCEAIRHILEITQPPHPAKDFLPKDVPVAFKWGGMEGVSVGWGIVDLPHRPYVFAIMTTYGQEPASAATMRSLSQLAYNYYSRLARANAYGARVPEIRTPASVETPPPTSRNSKVATRRTCSMKAD